jgi:hypothetical protein
MNMRLKMGLMVSLALFCAGTCFAMAAAADTTCGFVKFEDPHEKAFTLEVPEGWTVKGGLYRLGFSDQRPMVDMTSPDGRTNIRLGDVAVAPYVLPTQSYPRDGAPYDLGAQAQPVVAKFRTGDDFAALYAEARFKQMCRNVARQKIDSPLQLPDVIPVENGVTVIQWSVGQVAYACNTSQGPKTAYAYARTELLQSLWVVNTLASFIAPADQVSAARNIVVRCVKSFHLNQRWLQHQKQMDQQGMAYARARAQQRMAAMGQQMQQFESRMSAMQNQVANFERGQAAMQSQVGQFEQRQDAFANQVQSFDNTLVGVTPTTDPLTGEHHDVWTGPKANYYRNGLGETINSTLSPGPGWTEQQRQQ